MLHGAVGAIPGSVARRWECLPGRSRTGSGVTDAGECATEAHQTKAPPNAVCDHRCGIGTRTNLAKKRDSAVRLLHHAEQRTPGLVVRLLGGGLRFAGSAP